MSGKGKKKEKGVGKKAKKIDISEPAVDEEASEASEPKQALPNVEDELEELRGRFQRLAADYQNYQKRSYKQIEQTGQLAREEMVKSLLAVLDNFKHTLEKGADIADAAAVLEGVKIVYDHFMNVLVGHGLKKIEIQIGDSFDPILHEAILHEESDECEENTILRELAAGYMMNGRTLRPAKVSVAKGVQEEEA